MLSKKIKNLPDKPGVYQFFDENGKLLYIGKAKSLKNRVKSYFRFSPSLQAAPNLSSRIKKMISECNNLEYFLVEHENDALILENSLIKQMKPKYNILLRDDKTYPYIYVDLSQDFPRFEITRKVIKGKQIHYFGPFCVSARELLASIYLLLPLVQKKSCAKGKKACLFYQIKQCLAPCENKISKENYRQIVQKAMTFASNPNLMIKDLEEKMFSYADNQNYEMAAVLREQIKNIKSLSKTSSLDLASLENFDIFAIFTQGNTSCAVKLFLREGKVISSAYKLTNYANSLDNDLNELYKQFILDSYPENSPLIVKKILTAHSFSDMELISNFLSKRENKKITILNPKIGEKKKLCEIALLNAKEIIKKEKSKSNYELLDKIKTDFNLSNFPNSIEVFDNSHLGGQACVGAMIRYEDDKFEKSKYRRYHLNANDEYSQMKELLTRRVKSFNELSPPDLFLIDGGDTLLRLAEDILKSYGSNVDVMAIAKEKIDAKAHRAKGAAKDKLHTSKFELSLASDDKRLQFFQKLRDEAHRFAIDFHRNTKRKQDKEKSNLTKLEISEAKIKKLLDFYGNFENIYVADFDELSSIVGEKTAKKIKN